MSLKDMRCKKCRKKGALRVILSLFLDIPLELYGRLGKQSLRRRDVKLDGAGWDASRIYCAACGWMPQRPQHPR